LAVAAAHQHQALRHQRLLAAGQLLRDQVQREKPGGAVGLDLLEGYLRLGQADLRDPGGLSCSRLPGTGPTINLVFSSCTVLVNP
jgi:hypothetical protein